MMESTSSVAILIVNWNSWDMLARCMKSLSLQTYNKFRVYVADNDSDYDPPEDIFSVLPDVVFIRNNRNCGFAAANNLLLEYAKDSDWTVLLNPDAFPEPDWLCRLMRAANENPDYTFFASRLLQDLNNDVLDGDGDVYHFTGLVWRKGHGRKLAKSSARPREVFSPCGAAAMYRTDILLDEGGLDEDYFCYVEDVDLGFRLRLAGHRCLLVPSAVVRHVGSATSGGQKSDFAVYHGHRNLVWTFVKDMPAPLFWIFLPFHILLNLFTIIWFVMRGQGKVIIKAKKDALAGLPAMWSKRANVQASRRGSIFQLMQVINGCLAKAWC